MRIHMPPSPGDSPRHFNSRARAEVVLQVLSGQSVELLAQETGFPAGEIQAWCGAFVHAGFAALGGGGLSASGPLAVQVQAAEEPVPPQVIDGPPPVRSRLRRVA